MNRVGARSFKVTISQSRRGDITDLAVENSRRQKRREGGPVSSLDLYGTQLTKINNNGCLHEVRLSLETKLQMPLFCSFLDEI